MGGEMSGQFEVMVLDDEPIVCERLKEYFKKNDLLVETFTVSQEAVDRLAQKRFDVVVTDLKMRGPNGLDVLHFVRQQQQGTQVIIITAYSSIEAAREAEYSGVFEFVDKPLHMDMLTKLVKKAANKARKLGKESVT
jgi:DNA-binding NtrC family response regulator